MDISIIVPVYNAEIYLERCVKSIIRALNRYEGRGEILLIDNNSLDESLDIMQKFKKKYPTIIRVLSCKNPGASAVRNFGFQRSNGKYIWFIDADDEITSSSIESLMHVAKSKDADFVMMGATQFFKKGNNRYIPALDTNSADFKSRFIRYGLGPWQIIIKASWYKKNNFHFSEGIIHEDMEMMPSLILYTDKIGDIDKSFYHYYENTGSVLHKQSWDPHYLDIFPALEGLYSRFDKVDAIKKYYHELEWFFIWNLLIDSAKDFAKSEDGHIGYKRSRENVEEIFPALEEE